MPTSVDERLLYEARVRTRIGVIAALGGVLLLISSIIQIAGPHANVNELTLGLITENKRFPLDIIANLIEGVGWVCIAITLNFLFASTQFRNPQLQPAFRVLAVVGTLLLAVTGLVSSIVVAIKAHEFVTTGSQTYAQANALTNSWELVSLSYVNLVGLLLSAIGFVLVSLNAMRVGLLTKFLGYIGMFAGVLVLFVLTPVPIVQTYWLVALGVLIAGRYPTGLPPAWLSGRAEPWPSSQQMREQRAAAQGRGQRGPRGRPAPAPAPAVPAEAPAATRATTPKRKRKRRK
jgi:hypothetical protein